MEMIATLQSIGTRSSGGGSGLRSSLSRESTGSILADSEERMFYDHNTEVNTGPRILALILMQSDLLLESSEQLPNEALQDRLGTIGATSSTLS